MSAPGNSLAGSRAAVVADTKEALAVEGETQVLGLGVSASFASTTSALALVFFVRHPNFVLLHSCKYRPSWLTDVRAKVVWG